MKITVSHTEKKEVTTSKEIEIPAYFKSGFGYYAILSEKKYIHVQADRFGDCQLGTWEAANFVAGIVANGEPVTAEVFNECLAAAKEAVDKAVSELSMVEFLAGPSEKATPAEIREERNAELTEYDPRN